MTALRILDIRDIAPLAPRLAERLSPDRLEKMRSHRLEEDRLRSLAAGLLLAREFGDRPLLVDKWGKPSVEGGPHFSVSHAGDYALLAVDDGPVGVDIEQRRGDDFRRLASVAFHPLEREALERDYTPERFFDTWTLKESYLKMLGLGFSKDPRSFSLIRDNDAAAVAEDGAARLKLYRVVTGYSLALCLHHDNWPSCVEPVSAEQLLR